MISQGVYGCLAVNTIINSNNEYTADIKGKEEFECGPTNLFQEIQSLFSGYKPYYFYVKVKSDSWNKIPISIKTDVIASERVSESSNLNEQPLQPNSQQDHLSSSQQNGVPNQPAPVTITKPYVRTLEATDIEENSAYIKGNLVSDGGDGGSRIGFEYGETTSYGNSVNVCEWCGEGEFDRLINKINPGTTYHYRAVASNSIGTSYGTDRIFTTSGNKLQISQNQDNQQTSGQSSQQSVKPQIPVARFTVSATSGSAPLTVLFSDMSSNNPTRWSWTIVKGTYYNLQDFDYSNTIWSSPSSSQTAKYQFNTPGDYTVLLIAENSGGGGSSIQHIVVYPPTPATTTTTVQITCTLPPCPSGQVAKCPGNCQNGCGFVCTAVTTPTPVTTTPTPVPPSVIGCWGYIKENPMPILKFVSDGTLLDYYKGQLLTEGRWTAAGTDTYSCTLRNTDTGGTTYFTLVQDDAVSMHDRDTMAPLRATSCP
jgi:hypothetical protein